MKILKSSIFIAFWLITLCASLVYGRDPDQNGQINIPGREKSFSKLDRNKDQFITADEWKGDVQTFLNLDCNRDQVLTQQEYVFANCHMDKREMAFLELDRNNNGVIEFEEWKDSQNNFYSLDRDRNGFISRNEYFAPSTKTKVLKQVLGVLLN
jgi:hypothetical protein